MRNRFQDYLRYSLGIFGLEGDSQSGALIGVADATSARPRIGVMLQTTVETCSYPPTGYEEAGSRRVNCGLTALSGEYFNGIARRCQAGREAWHPGNAALLCGQACKHGRPPR